MSQRAVIEVAAAIIRRGETILITQRPVTGHLPNLWEFPGGKREAGESFEQCLARELHEELGVAARVGGLVYDVTHTYPERAVRLCFFECDLLDGEPQPIHCQACRWVRLEELKQYQFPPADDGLIKLLTTT